MDDDSWRNLVEPWQRVMWARAQKFETKKDAAAALGWKEGTYNAYERPPGSSKHTELTHQTAMHIAKKFKVRWEWLLFGVGEPKRKPAQERIFAAMEALAAEEQEHIADVIETMMRKRA